MAFLKALWLAIAEIFSKKITDRPIGWPLTLDEPMPEPIPVPQETPPKPPVVPVVHSKLWCGGTLEERKAMYALAMQICAQEGLDKLPSRILPGYTMRADVLATLYGESGFNQWCVNETTKDYGLCQFSAIYYLKEYNMAPQYAIDNPAACLKIMADNFKAGRETNWVAYQGLQRMAPHVLTAHIQYIISTHA